MALAPAVRNIVLGGGFDPARIPGCVLALDDKSAVTLSVAPITLTGTASQTGTTLTGVGSAFTGEVAVGDVLTATGINGTVTAIASATSLTLSSSTTSGAGLTITCTPQAGVTDRVSQWNDRALSNHASQATATKRPLYKAKIVNGLPAMRFDGVDDSLSVTTTLNQPLTTILVGKTSGENINQYFFDGLSNNNLVISNAGLASTLRLYAGATIDKPLGGTTLGLMSVISGVFNDLSSQVGLNGAMLSGSGGTHNGIGLTIGGSFLPPSRLNGDIAAFYFYTRVLSENERKRCERWLGAKYAIAVTS